MRLSKLVSENKGTRVIEMISLITISLTFMLMRSDAITARGQFNPDEAELLADGLRAARSFIPFEDFTSPTFGPIWPMFLGLLHRAGLPLTLPVAHLLSALILITICQLLMLVTLRRFQILTASLICLPFVLQFATGLGNYDYLSLSTELLPLLLLVLATHLTFRNPITFRNLLVISALETLVVLSKYFFAPLAFIGLLFLLQKSLHDGIDWKRATSRIAIGASLPIIVLVGWALIGGVPSWKILESPIMTFQYFQGGGLGTNSCAELDLLGNIRQSLSGHIATFALLLLGLILGLKSFSQDRTKKQVFTLCLFTSPVLVSILLLMRTCTIFPHYNYLLVGGILQSYFAFTTSSAEPQISNTNDATRNISLLMSFVIAQVLLTNVSSVWTAPLVQNNESLVKVLSPDSAISERGWTSSNKPLSEICRRKSSVLIWGWSPDLFSYYNWQPSSRYVTTTLMMDTQMFAHDTTTFRLRLEKDLLTSKIDCVVVAVGPSFFGGFTEKDSMKSQMPQLWNQLKTQMDEVTVYWDRVNPVTILVAKEKTNSTN